MKFPAVSASLGTGSDRSRALPDLGGGGRQWEAEPEGKCSQTEERHRAFCLALASKPGYLGLALSCVCLQRVDLKN